MLVLVEAEADDTPMVVGAAAAAAAAVVRWTEDRPPMTAMVAEVQTDS